MIATQCMTWLCSTRRVWPHRYLHASLYEMCSWHLHLHVHSSIKAAVRRSVPHHAVQYGVLMINGHIRFVRCSREHGCCVQQSRYPVNMYAGSINDYMYQQSLSHPYKLADAMPVVDLPRFIKVYSPIYQLTEENSQAASDCNLL